MSVPIPTWLAVWLLRLSMRYFAKKAPPGMIGWQINNWLLERGLIKQKYSDDPKDEMVFGLFREEYAKRWPVERKSA